MAGLDIPPPTKLVTRLAGVVWLVLVIAVAFVPDQPGIAGKLFVALVSTVGTAAFAVSGIGFLIEARQRRRWERETRRLVVDALDLLTDALADQLESTLSPIAAGLADLNLNLDPLDFIYVPSNGDHRAHFEEARTKLRSFEAAVETTTAAVRDEFHKLTTAALADQDRRFEEAEVGFRQSYTDPSEQAVSEPESCPPLCDATIQTMSDAVQTAAEGLVAYADQVLEQAHELVNVTDDPRLAKNVIELALMQKRWAKSELRRRRKQAGLLDESLRKHSQLSDLDANEIAMNRISLVGAATETAIQFHIFWSLWWGSLDPVFEFAESGTRPSERGGKLFRIADEFATQVDDAYFKDRRKGA
jgi:hypothetical protein